MGVLVLAACAGTVRDEPGVTTAELPAPPTAASAAARSETKQEPRSRLEECKAFRKVFNSASLGEHKGMEPAQLMAEHREALRLEREIGALGVRDEGLSTIAADFRHNLKEYAAMMKRAAEVDRNDIEELARLRQRAGEVSATQTELRERFKDHCAK